jgi:bacterial/archaeal transporter family protein
MSHIPADAPIPGTPGLRCVQANSILRMPAWLLYSLLTILLWGVWGVVSKIASRSVDTYTNQVFFTIGVLPLMFLVIWSPRIRDARRIRAGSTWAFVTGLLGGIGNIAFFYALMTGGKASIVVPVTALFPVVTVILAVTILRERVGAAQWCGLLLSFAAIYMLSM